MSQAKVSVYIRLLLISMSQGETVYQLTVNQYESEWVCIWLLIDSSFGINSLVLGMLCHSHIILVETSAPNHFKNMKLQKNIPSDETY